MSTWVLRTDLDLDAINLHLADLQTAGLLGLVEEHGAASAWFPRRVEGLEITGRWEEVPDADWNAAWRERLEPVTAGGFTIAPPWKASPGPGVIVIEPGQAFGTGHHETTTGCLQALCALDLRGRHVLDVGTGSGILAVAAALLGAGRVVAVDTDPLAVAAAAGAARDNGTEVTVRQGSVEAAVGERFDVVVANLDTSTLTRLADALVDRLHAGGSLVASGVSVERSREAVAALARAGCAVSEQRVRDWVVLTGRRGG